MLHLHTRSACRLLGRAWGKGHGASFFHREHQQMQTDAQNTPNNPTMRFPIGHSAFKGGALGGNVLEREISWDKTGTKSRSPQIQTGNLTAFEHHPEASCRALSPTARSRDISKVGWGATTKARAKKKRWRTGTRRRQGCRTRAEDRHKDKRWMEHSSSVGICRTAAEGEG
jgi:hypothetical protein